MTRSYICPVCGAREQEQFVPCCSDRCLEIYNAEKRKASTDRYHRWESHFKPYQLADFERFKTYLKVCGNVHCQRVCEQVIAATGDVELTRCRHVAFFTHHLLAPEEYPQF